MRGIEAAVQVGVDQGVVILEADSLHAARRDIGAGDVDQHVDAPLGSKRGGSHHFQGRVRTHVGGGASHAVRQRSRCRASCGGCRKGRRAASNQDQVPAARGEGAGGGAPDSGTSAGDDRHSGRRRGRFHRRFRRINRAVGIIVMAAVWGGIGSATSGILCRQIRPCDLSSLRGGEPVGAMALRQQPRMAMAKIGRQEERAHRQLGGCL